MDDPETARRAAVAGRAAADGAALANEYGEIQAETKTGPTDYVTAADHAAQRLVLDRLAAAYPEEPVVGEEDGDDERLRDSVPETGPAWIVDPVDGTANYVRGLPTWACAVACVAVDDRTDPRECSVVPFYWWSHDERDAYAAGLDAAVRRFDDVRRPGCAQASLASVADGGVSGVFTDRRVASWDAAAGVHLVRRAGGRVTDLGGQRWTVGARGLVASNGVDAVHEALATCARAAAEASGRTR